MKVSIIVPVYNVEKYLHRCIDSLLAQSYSDFEVLLIDDGSTDQSGIICDEYARIDHRVEALHQKNRGVSAARNHGLMHASGEYVAFCDSDDFCQADWLKKLVEPMESQNVDLVTASYWYVDEWGTKLSKRKRYPGHWSIQTRDEKNDYYRSHVLDKKGEWNGWELWTSLFRNSIIKENSLAICETSCNFAEDLGFLLEYILYAKQVVCIDDVSYCYVQHNGSMMASSVEKVKLNSLNEISKHFGKRYIMLYSRREDRKFFSVLHFLIMNDQYEKIWYGEDAKRLSAEIGKIADKTWYMEWNRCLDSNWRQLLQLFGRKRGGEYLLWNRYCCSQKWKRFALESAIFYKFIVT